MKKIAIFVFAFIISIFFLSACKNGVIKEDKNAKPQVYVSFYAMHDFTNKIGGDKIDLFNMAQPGVEPHDFEPTSNDIINLEKADLFVYSGAGMEHWVDKVFTSLKNKDLVIVEASKAVPVLGESSDKASQSSDPHVWLSPKNAKIECENIKNGLILADPLNKDTYEENYQLLSKRFDDLYKEYRDKLTPLAKKDIIVAHRAYSYLCSEYGLNQIALEGLSPHSEPDPAKMSEIITYCRQNNINTIFFEESLSNKTAKIIADEANVKLAVLNPLETISQSQILASEDYFSVMKSNLLALEEALK